MMNAKSGVLPEPQLTVVVPVYNEELTLPDVLPPLVKLCSWQNYRLILINDGSKDKTSKILDSCRNMPGIVILQHKINRGYGSALKTGIMQTETPFLVTFDGDGQHDPTDITKILDFALEKDADLVIGTRSTKLYGNWYREFGKSIIRKFSNLLIPFTIHDLNSGFKLYRSDLAKKYIRLCPDSMSFSEVITLIFINQRNMVLEFPIAIKHRMAGKSTIRTFTAFETILEIINIVMLFNPLRIFIPVSVSCILVGLIWGIPFVLMGRGVSVGSMLAIVTGLLFFTIGLIASQLSAIRMGMLDQKDE